MGPLWCENIYLVFHATGIRSTFIYTSYILLLLSLCAYTYVYRYTRARTAFLKLHLETKQLQKPNVLQNAFSRLTSRSSSINNMYTMTPQENACAAYGTNFPSTHLAFIGLKIKTPIILLTVAVHVHCARVNYFLFSLRIINSFYTAVIL